MTQKITLEEAVNSAITSPFIAGYKLFYCGEAILHACPSRRSATLENCHITVETVSRASGQSGLLGQRTFPAEGDQLIVRSDGILAIAVLVQSGANDTVILKVIKAMFRAAAEQLETAGNAVPPVPQETTMLRPSRGDALAFSARPPASPMRVQGS